MRLAALLRHAARSANARAVLVAPAAGGDGTGLTTSLAEGLAAVQGKALLVDANLRGRGLTRHYDLEARPGLAEAAAADGAAPDVSHEVPSAAGHLRVVPAGAAAAQPAALVASDGVVRALHMLCAGPDVALVASAPLVAAPEAPVLASAVDGVLLLVEVGIDRRDVAELRRILDVSSSAPLGFVLLSRAPRGWSVAGRKGSAAATAATLEAQPMVGEA